MLGLMQNADTALSWSCCTEKRRKQVDKKDVKQKDAGQKTEREAMGTMGGRSGTGCAKADWL